jgi:hypothetical protein
MIRRRGHNEDRWADVAPAARIVRGGGGALGGDFAAFGDRPGPWSRPWRELWEFAALASLLPSVVGSPC